MSSPSRLLTALIALLAVIAIVLAAAVHQRNTPKARFGRFCRALQSPPGRGAVTPITVGTPTVVVLGDSYASGFALAEPRQAWPTQLGRVKRWEVFVDGVAGTGLTNGGFCAQPYASRVGQVLLHHPQRVLVEVRLNDTGASSAALQRAADALLGRLSAVAQVDVVGPPPVPAKLLGRLATGRWHPARCNATGAPTLHLHPGVELALPARRRALDRCRASRVRGPSRGSRRLSGSDIGNAGWVSI